ncbi:sugar phosphate isomerase/epimerase [Stieleria sp. TO1_6]|uniref:sugar phosphate isomerase/epimerase family protein n=1 Tax=Stieleria tagensis TaxID=2956795 RepID=UPI00209AC6C7|nr:sugar phosphate isomerase/epimerase family protein [Stieleria tagensis]MCO8124603.1 sugar phosphate isomerase/epimerase [Stieleria tagensis]
MNQPPPNKSNSPVTLGRRAALGSAGLATLTAWLARPLQGLADDPPETPPEKPIEQPAEKTNTQPQQPAPPSDTPPPYLDRIGLQLYTVRDQMAEDPATTLKAIAAAGYKQVELMKINRDSLQIAAIARDNGLMVHSGFLDWRTIATPSADGVMPVEQTVEMAERIGLRHVVFGYIDRKSRETADQCKAIAERANQAARRTRDAGMRMAYHNHSFEFAKLPGADKAAYDIFIERFDPQLMDFELDVFWAKLGGRDPLDLMKHLAGRITMLHLKDLKAGVGVIYDEGNVPEDAFQECGDGVIDLPGVMRLGKEIGVQECHVEQDESPAPLESIVQSYQFLSGKKA